MSIGDAGGIEWQLLCMFFKYDHGAQKKSVFSFSDSESGSEFGADSDSSYDEEVHA